MNHPQQQAPKHLEVVKYFLRLGLDQKHAEAFYHYYSHLKWEYRPGRKVKNWKVLAFQWVKSFGAAAPLQHRSIAKTRKATQLAIA